MPNPEMVSIARTLHTLKEAVRTLEMLMHSAGNPDRPERPQEPQGPQIKNHEGEEKYHRFPGADLSHKSNDRTLRNHKGEEKYHRFPGADLSHKAEDVQHEATAVRKAMHDSRINNAIAVATEITERLMNQR